jgi:hypothetical protein
MSLEAVQALIDRWDHDPAFRAAVRQDPEGTIRATGVELDPLEWDAIRAIDWSLSDDELRARTQVLGYGL